MIATFAPIASENLGGSALQSYIFSQALIDISDGSHKTSCSFRDAQS